MLKLNILKNVTLRGQVYKSGDSVEVHKTLLHYEVQEVPSSLQILLDADLISVTAPNTYEVLGDIVVTLGGQNYAKNDTFVAPKAFAYVDVVDYPKWIAEGVTANLWTLDDGIIHVTGVTLAPTSFSIAVGATQTVVATVAPSNAADKTGVWASSDVTVATVSNTGVVTALKVGTASITFTSTDGSEVGTSAGTITAAVIHVTGVTLNDPTFSTDAGTTHQLTATVAPANATTKTGVWASSNTAVATVSNTGLVTGVAAGTANITFTTTDGAFVATSVATITTPVVVPTSVTISPASPTTTVGGTVALTAAITPAGSTDKTGVWSSATPAVATVAQDGTVTGVSVGTSVVTFTTNSGARTANRTVTITA